MSSRGKRGIVAILAVAVVLAFLNTLPKKPTRRQIIGTPALQADANDLEATIVTPHMAVSLEPDKNVLWCATFQLAWNELADLLGDKLDQYQSSSEMVPLLNQRSVTKDDLDEACYIAMAGYPTGGPNDILDRVTAALVEQFGRAASPELLPSRETLAPTDWVAYAYLFKSLPFEWAFERDRTHGISFSGRDIQTFGIDQLLARQENEVNAARQVRVYDPRGEDDFIVELKTQSESDRLILAKVPPADTLAETIATVRARLESAVPEDMNEHSDLEIRS